MHAEHLFAVMNEAALTKMVTALVPTMARSLAEQFNVFRVMHHGTHEKQLSNVFAWLLRVDATHHLGDAFQRILLARINSALSRGEQLPLAGFRVLQEVDTTTATDPGKDIADIVLLRDDTAVMIENFESSDGHGHDYESYLAYGSANGRRSVVVMLCARRERQRLSMGWEDAVVITYAEVLDDLRAHLDADRRWRGANPRQDVFINELIDQFVEGPQAMTVQEQLEFIKTMCETGESARYGRRPVASIAEDFAAQIALHAQRQFEDSRSTLGSVKRTLRQHAVRVVRPRVNELLGADTVHSVSANFQGQWEWCSTLVTPRSKPNIFLEFGPTAVTENERAPEPVSEPDYSRVFVTRQAGAGIDRIVQTDVTLEEVLAGLADDDQRLVDVVATLIRDHPTLS
ncbi:PD-(D/E)XK nuclease family protein [Curtobacterium sp. MCPF17_001]|uniref:PD-(D/E)XK nuclease family protein n=1 Tax=Curtobacterium sp. MCPF17_001 TaxID=2175651 RepID=UPI0021AC74D9|nr:PD-(D/E)XK nuclease family protein [Curtobacterium sp. MCPF17_001]